MRVSLHVLLISMCALLTVTGGASCKDRRQSETLAPEHTGPSRDAAAGPGDAGAADTDTTAIYAPEQWARYRRHLHLGRARARKRLFGEALREFEKALEVIPMDARALSEIGWAAFQAGDYERARAANQDAIRTAADPGVRAASMYNLGRVAEAMGDREEAERQYRASLALRPHAGVEQRLARLSEPPAEPRPADRVVCGPYATPDQVCACALEKASGRTPGAGMSCQREARGIKDVELLFAGDDTEEWVHLIKAGPDGWSSIALLGYVYDAGETGANEEFELARFENRLIGDRQALWIETVQTRTDASHADRGVVRRRVHSLVVCPWSVDHRQLACTLEVPLSDVYERQPEARRERKLDVDVRPDGTARVVLESGEKNDAVAPLLGEHRLW